MKNALAEKAKMAKTKEKIREIPVILAETKNLDAEHLQTFARTLIEPEIKALVDFAHTRNEDKKAAQKDYEAARLIIQARARLDSAQAVEGDGATAKFESRDYKEINAWKVLQELRQSSFWINGKKKDQIELFNRIFKVQATDARGILGEDVVYKCTDVTTDPHAVLKLKGK